MDDLRLFMMKQKARYKNRATKEILECERKKATPAAFFQTRTDII